MEPSKKVTKIKISDLILTFLMPTFIGKSLVLYFGLNYSSNPNDKDLTGLILSILFTLTMLSRFLWRYRHYED